MARFSGCYLSKQQKRRISVSLAYSEVHNYLDIIGRGYNLCQWRRWILFIEDRFIYFGILL